MSFLSLMTILNFCGVSLGRLFFSRELVAPSEATIVRA